MEIIPINERRLPYEIVRASPESVQASIEAAEEAKRLAKLVEYPPATVHDGSDTSSFIIKFVPKTEMLPKRYMEHVPPVVKNKGGYQVSDREEPVYSGPPTKICGALPESGEKEEITPPLPQGTALTRVRVTPEEVEASIAHAQEAKRLAATIVYPKAKVHDF